MWICGGHIFSLQHIYKTGCIYVLGNCLSFFWIRAKYLTRKMLSKTMLCVFVAQLCLTICHPMDSRLPTPFSMEFSRQGYWNELPFLFSRGSSQFIEPGSPTLQVDSLPFKPPETLILPDLVCHSTTTSSVILKAT